MPRAVVATSRPTISRVAAVNIGWSGYKKRPNKAIRTVREIPSLNPASSSEMAHDQIKPGTSTCFRPTRSDRYPIIGLAISPIAISKPM